MKLSAERAYSRMADQAEHWDYTALREPDRAFGRARIDYHGPMVIKGLKVTWNQYQVYRYWREHPGEKSQMRKIADSLGIAVSTVSRAFTRLTILQLAWVDSRRGRYGGTRFIIPPQSEWRERAKKALARLRYAKKRDWRRWTNRFELITKMAGGERFGPRWEALWRKHFGALGGL